MDPSTLVRAWWMIAALSTSVPLAGGEAGLVPPGPAEPILLNSGTVAVLSRPARPAGVGRFEGRRLHLIQLSRPVDAASYDSILATGVRVIAWVPHRSYLVWGDSEALERLDMLAARGGAFGWSGPYGDEAKIDASLARSSAKAGGEATVAVALQLVRDGDVNEATFARLRDLAISERGRFEILHYVNVVLEVRREHLRELAARPDVVSIQPWAEPVLLGERQAQIVAGNLAGGTPSGPGYLAWLASRGFTQAQFTLSGLVVDVADSGIDTGTIDPLHAGLRVGGQSAGASRIAYARLEGTPNAGSTLKGCDGHGTLNAHLVGGFNDLSGFPHADGAGFRYGLGVNPFVRLGSSVVFDPNEYTHPDLGGLLARAWEDGARISLNAWGAANGGRYDLLAQAFDALTRDAQQGGGPFPTPGNQEMLLVAGAGNGGPAFQTVHSPATAKNALTIGASEGVQSFGGADVCGVDDAMANDARDLAPFSSRGPTIDGRRKPELVAPGSHLSGGLVQAPGAGSNGQADACFDAAGICGAAGSPFFPASQALYTGSSGSSHAAAAAAGAAALVRQWFANAGMPSPSPAMTRAVLVAAATPLSGAGADGVWSVGQGMGRLDLGRTFDDTARIFRDQLASDAFDASGQQRTFLASVNDPSRPLRITLAWTDAPGSTAGAAWANDLDLVVHADGRRYHGNVFDGTTSTPGGTRDSRNNLESVFLPAGTTGPIVVEVQAADINSDGVPSWGGPLDQDFALVISNATPFDGPVAVAGDAALEEESCAPANLVVDPWETVTVSLSLTNRGASPTSDLVASLVATGGVTTPGPPQSYGVVAPGATVARSFTFKADGACGTPIVATLELTDGGSPAGRAEFILPLGVLNSDTQPFAAAGPVTIPPAGTATPYPSTISVSGLPGTISKVAVTLEGLSHGFADDLDILLVGPGGSVVLMSDSGGGDALEGLVLTFDDDAPFPLPDGSGIASGSYRPTSHGESDSFPAPAPAPPYGASLGVFEGNDPNGTWSLYVVDDSDVDGGAIDGWTLSLTTSSGPACCVPPGTLQFTTSSYSGAEPGSAIVRVVRSNGDSGGVSVMLTTSDGTATAGDDYTATAQMVSFLPGDSGPKQVVIPILDDELDEPSETIQLTLSSPTGGAVLGARSAAVLTIADDDPPPAAAATSPSKAEGDSGASAVSVTVTLSAASALPISMSWQTADGDAAAGTDYVAGAGMLDFPPGAVSRTIEVDVLGDGINELDETFAIEFASPVNVQLPPSPAVVTIVDDDILSVAAITPGSGPDGGTEVSVTGAHFAPGATLDFGGIGALQQHVSSPGEITAVTPPLPPGSLHGVTVTNPNGLASTLPRGFLSDFLDVPGSHALHGRIEAVFRAGITAGCGGGNYCPGQAVSRAQMAVFLLRSVHGAGYTPPPASGTMFADVPADAFAAAWIEQLAVEGITSGCAASPPRFCPADPVNRAQMAIFLLRAKHGSSYVPPAATGIFEDVPVTSPVAPWVEQLRAEQVTAGCSAAPLRYCPNDPNTRGQMAVFIDKAFDLTGTSSPEP